MFPAFLRKKREEEKKKKTAHIRVVNAILIIFFLSGKLFQGLSHLCSLCSAAKLLLMLDDGDDKDEELGDVESDSCLAA